MKKLILTLMFVSIANAFAANPQPETVRIAKLLLYSPDVVQQLNQEYTDRLTDVQSTEVESGVTEYVLTFKRSCFCLERTATVKINEDLRPTFLDAMPKYESSVTFK